MEVAIHSGLEQVMCNLCQENRTRLFTMRQGMQIVQCVNCGLVYVNPRPDTQRLHLHYNSGQSSRIQYYLDVEVADRRTFFVILDLAERLVPQRGALLDVGPNIGTCLALARERGWATYGIEINAEAARYCREQRALDVLCGAFEEDTYPDNTFNVVLMSDVIEHLRDPFQVMSSVQRVLRPGGVVIISTPNIATWSGRLLQIKPEEHLYYFSPATMERLLRAAGLEVIDIEPLDRYHNLTAMTHSTTFGRVFQLLGPVFRLVRRAVGDVVVKLPLHENLMAVGRKPPVRETGARPPGQR